MAVLSLSKKGFMATDGMAEVGQSLLSVPQQYV